MENNELQNLVLEIAKQNLMLGQSLSQQNTQLNQRIDVQSQRIDAIITRMDNAIQQMQQQHQELVKLSYGVISALEKLPEVVKEQIGFKKV